MVIRDLFGAARHIATKSSFAQPSTHNIGSKGEGGEKVLHQTVRREDRPTSTHAPLSSVNLQSGDGGRHFGHSLFKTWGPDRRFHVT